jgi:NAD(P)-dependent dehydrogenase (short-subunit alcohol dehydrogenase family)
MRLANKRALVTGGASGIGYAIVERFLQEGAAVAFCDIAPEATERARKALSAVGGKVAGLVADVSNSADCRKAVDEAVRFLGGLDILVNNAGIDVKGSVVDISEEDWERQIAVNLGGVYRMSKYALPEIIKAGGGAVVNIGSIAAFLGYPRLAAYGASKGAVVQLTRNMATDFAPYNVRVNSVNPGVVDTPLLEHACKTLAGPNGDWQAVKQNYLEGQLLRRAAQPWEIAAAVLYLASDEAGFVTGSALMIDGGYQIQG